MFETLWPWIAFNLFVIVMLVLDLSVFFRKHHVIKIRESLIASAFWIALALIFNVGIYYTMGKEAALNFFTGYLIEKSLSLDNLFVFLVIFKYFQTPREYAHKVLFLGIFGAIVMRAFFIIFGIALVSTFHWVLYIFGAFLIYIGIQMAIHEEKTIDPGKNLLTRLLKKFMPVTDHYVNGHFFIKSKGHLYATPLFVTLITIESSDLIFAVDSIPAIMAITLDPFIIYTSNIFAILGLRALYFALAGMMDLFRFLHYGLAAILIFVGIKMLIAPFFKIPIIFALGFIVITLLLSILFSIKKSSSN